MIYHHLSLSLRCLHICVVCNIPPCDSSLRALSHDVNLAYFIELRASIVLLQGRKIWVDLFNLNWPYCCGNDAPSPYHAREWGGGGGRLVFCLNGDPFNRLRFPILTDSRDQSEQVLPDKPFPQAQLLLSGELKVIQTCLSTLDLIWRRWWG